MNSNEMKIETTTKIRKKRSRTKQSFKSLNDSLAHFQVFCTFFDDSCEYYAMKHHRHFFFVLPLKLLIYLNKYHNGTDNYIYVHITLTYSYSYSLVQFGSVHTRAVYVQPILMSITNIHSVVVCTFFLHWMRFHVWKRKKNHIFTRLELDECRNAYRVCGLARTLTLYAQRRTIE